MDKKFLVIGIFTLQVFLGGIPLKATPLTVFTEENPPLNYVANGKLAGLSAEIIKSVLKGARINYNDIRVGIWSDIYNLALKEKNVMIFSIVRSLKRENNFIWGNEIYPYRSYLYRHKFRKDIQVISLEDAKKYKIGAVTDDVRCQFLESKGFHVVKVKRNALNIRKLFMDRIDMFPSGEITAFHSVRKEGFKKSDLVKVIELEEMRSGYYYAFSKGTDLTIVTKCRQAFNRLREDGKIEQIQKKYLDIEGFTE